MDAVRLCSGRGSGRDISARDPRSCSINSMSQTIAANNSPPWKRSGEIPFADLSDLSLFSISQSPSRPAYIASWPSAADPATYPASEISVPFKYRQVQIPPSTSICSPGALSVRKDVRPIGAILAIGPGDPAEPAAEHSSASGGRGRTSCRVAGDRPGLHARGTRRGQRSS